MKLAERNAALFALAALDRTCNGETHYFHFLLAPASPNTGPPVEFFAAPNAKARQEHLNQPKSIIIMKILIPLFSLCLAPITTLSAATLMSGSLSDYVALGTMGGTIGSTRFSNFTLLPLQFGATELSPDNIIVNPIGGQDMPGLEFVINDSASETDLFQSYFTFTVSGPQITGATLSVADTATSGGSGISVIEDFDFMDQPDMTMIVFQIAGEQELSAQSSFGAVSTFNVTMDITLDGGGESGLASLGTVTTQFAAVPEPMSTALIAGPLALMAALRRRRA